MKHLTILIIVFFLIFSCKKNIEIDENRLFIKGGIKSDLIIAKVKDNRLKKNDRTFPHLYSTIQKIRLKISGEGMTYIYDNGEKKHLLNDKPFEYKNELNFNSKNDNYKWTIEKPIDNKIYEKLPMEFEKEHWYFIRDIKFRGSESYLEFYINKNGEFEYKDLKYIMLSPI